MCAGQALLQLSSLGSLGPAGLCIWAKAKFVGHWWKSGQLTPIVIKLLPAHALAFVFLPCCFLSHPCSAMRTAQHLSLSSSCSTSYGAGLPACSRQLRPRMRAPCRAGEPEGGCCFKSPTRVPRPQACPSAASFNTSPVPLNLCAVAEATEASVNMDAAPLVVVKSVPPPRAPAAPPQPVAIEHSSAFLLRSRREGVSVVAADSLATASAVYRALREGGLFETCCRLCTASLRSWALR